MIETDPNFELNGFGVYMLYDPRNDLPIYVGKSNNVNSPWFHINEVRLNLKGKNIKNNIKFYKIKNHTDKSRKLMSDWKKEHYVGEGNPFYGKHHLDESKKKISENSAFRRPEIKQKDINLLKGKLWPAARRASHEKTKLLKNQNKENQK
jgi:hypothetical protein